MSNESRLRMIAVLLKIVENPMVLVLLLDIAFYGYRILLLGDAHPTTVIQSYEKVTLLK